MKITQKPLVNGVLGLSMLLIVLILAACSSAPRSQGNNHTVFKGFAVGPVREAARVVVEEVAHPKSVIRITDEGSVLTQGWIGVCGEEVACGSWTGHDGHAGTPWTTIEVRFRELKLDTAIEVEIEYEDCDPDPSCQPELLGSTGALEKRIIDGMRIRLEQTESDQHGTR
ncbi:MAG TPA: hypothetical protein VH681_01710 [Nitrospiraceae bacterium]